jgi:hypothetical protein
MTYTTTNHKDNISNTYATLGDALAMATRCYDGAGIICTITDSNGVPVAYSFTARGEAYI